MLYYLGEILEKYWGPARLLQSYAVLLVLAVYLGFFLSLKLIPKFYDKLPHDRGREFTLKDNAEAAKGKPTGAGCVFYNNICFTLFSYCSNVTSSWSNYTSNMAYNAYRFPR